MQRMIQMSTRLAGRLTRIALTTGWVSAVCLTLTPNALAAAPNGRGWWGEVNDKVVTDFGFLLIIGFPLLILIFSLIQWRLDRRKTARKAAEKALLANANWHGGW